MKINPTVLIVGATGATGKHLVQSLLKDGYPVSAIVRSKERLLSLIDLENVGSDLLAVTETPSFHELSDAEYQQLVDQADVIVSCLGHTLNLSGIWGSADRRLVTETVKRLTVAAATKGNQKKFILMSSDGVVGPNDDLRPFAERAILSLFRYMFTPHIDNEEAAAYLQREYPPANEKMDWIIVRPTNLVEDSTNVSGYQVHDKPLGSLFGDTKVSRTIVAQFMKDLICDPKLWEHYSYRMPVLHNAIADGAPSKE